MMHVRFSIGELLFAVLIGAICVSLVGASSKIGRTEDELRDRTFRDLKTFGQPVNGLRLRVASIKDHYQEWESINGQTSL